MSRVVAFQLLVLMGLELIDSFKSNQSEMLSETANICVTFDFYPLFFFLELLPNKKPT